jgi:hypothetical protein
LDPQRLCAAFQKKPPAAKPAAFLLFGKPAKFAKFGVRTLFHMMKKCSDPEFLATLIKLHLVLAGLIST